MDNKWSPEYPLDEGEIKKNVPEEPGVYRIKQSQPYNRYKGTTNVLKIGRSNGDLRAELRNHLGRHTAANRIERIKKEKKITFDFQVKKDGAKDLEKELLKRFENEHWDLPILNSTRGYKRGEDKHFNCFTEKPG